MDDLKQKAGEQGTLLVQKQSEADNALKDITVAMQVYGCGGDQKEIFNKRCIEKC